LIRPVGPALPDTPGLQRPGNRLGHISADGSATRSYDLPTPGSEPHGLALGPDGAVWAALEIGRVVRLSA
jgi:virginiamycin B lyase